MEKGDQRTAHLDEAVSGAIAVPMKVLELASEVATLAADVAETGNRNLEGDALAGSLLAEAAARSAATLAQMNMSMLSRARRGQGPPGADAPGAGEGHASARARRHGVRARVGDIGGRKGLTSARGMVSNTDSATGAFRHQSLTPVTRGVTAKLPG